ncbi:DNA methyltransferase [Haloquadratum walsbyi]|nr:DNA methyltransferase [Haloquadratum walsbyi]
MSKKTSNQMYIVDLREAVSSNQTLREALTESNSLWKPLYNRMGSSETLWIIVSNEYRGGKMWPAAMAAADYIRNQASFILKNTITVHNISDDNNVADMISAYNEILFFVKDKRNYQFHKDEIRVSHVYEGNEWGGEREKGTSAYHDTEVRRYNPDGKDPGNVWLEEDRSQTPNQELDETRPIPFDESIRRCIRVGSQEKEKIHTIWATNLADIITCENREFIEVDVDVLQSESERKS